MVSVLQGCYYDNEETLYPGQGNCDTSNVTYSGSIVPIVMANCNECHSSAFPNGNVVTETYEGLKTVADDGRLWGTVSHNPNYPAMPKDRPQLQECDLRKIKIWIDNGALNN